LKIKDVKEAAGAWHKANACSNTRKLVEGQRLERETKDDVIDVEVDLINIHDLFLPKKVKVRICWRWNLSPQQRHHSNLTSAHGQGS
jgi:hypothetical protein